MNTTWLTRPIQLAVALAAVAIAVLVTADYSSAGGKVDGVRASLKKGTLKVKGGGQANSVALRLNGDQSQIQVDVGDNGSADFSFDRGDISAIKVQTGNAGDTVRLDDSNGAYTNMIPTTVAGGGGNDSLQGGQLVAVAQNEKYKGGDGNDAVDGGRGNDIAYLGGGNDSFRWDPGEGSDVLEGQDGIDTMLFNGAPGAETVDMSANGERLRFLREPAGITMDTNDIEVVDFNALAGIDVITVNDLTGTDVTKTNLDLASTLGGSAADAADDIVFVNGTNGDDSIDITGNGSGVDVTGLATAVSVKHPDLADLLAVDTRTGTDNVTPTGVAGVLQVRVDGVAL